jgi:hypothetical protein
MLVSKLSIPHVTLSAVLSSNGRGDKLSTKNTRHKNNTAF